LVEKHGEKRVPKADWEGRCVREGGWRRVGPVYELAFWSEGKECKGPCGPERMLVLGVETFGRKLHTGPNGVVLPMTRIGEGPPLAHIVEQVLLPTTSIDDK